MVPQRVTRRQLLLATGTVAAGGVALTQYDTPDTLPLIAVENARTEPVEVDVTILRDDALVYWETVALGANDPDDDAPLPTTTLEGTPQKAGEYTLYARLDGNDEYVRRSAETAPDSCLSVRVREREEAFDDSSLEAFEASSGFCEAVRDADLEP